MIYFILLGIWTLLSYPLLKSIFKKSYKKKYCILEGIFMTLIMGLRIKSTAGIDTEYVYFYYFEKLLGTSFSDVADYIQKDVLFFWVTKFIGIFTDDFQIYVFIIAVFVIGSFTWFVYKYSSQPQLSFVLYMALGYYGISFQILRHAVATSVLLFSYKFILEKKPIQFTIIVLLAACFHASALIFLIAYPLRKWEIGKSQFIVIALSGISMLLLKDQMLDLLYNFLGLYMRYAKILDAQSTIGLSGAFILLLVFLVSYFLLFKKNQHFTDETTILLNMSTISIAFMFMVGIIGEFHRISMFFGMFNTILLPKAVFETTKFKNKNKMVIVIAMEIVLLVYFLAFGLDNAGLLNYKLFWQ